MLCQECYQRPPHPRCRWFLCEHCRSSAEVLAEYRELPKPSPPEMTSAPPGSEEKIEIMRQRVASGFSPFHDLDVPLGGQISRFFRRIQKFYCNESEPRYIVRSRSSQYHATHTNPRDAVREVCGMDQRDQERDLLAAGLNDPSIGLLFVCADWVRSVCGKKVKLTKRRMPQRANSRAA
jgi:hypothetical protein